MRILVLNGSYRKEGGMSAMAKAFCAGARGVYEQAEGIYRTYLVGLVRRPGPRHLRGHHLRGQIPRNG